MERRQINLSSITGMDVRDISDENNQQHVKEIINLNKDKNGWTIRNSSKTFLSAPASGNTLTPSQNVQEIINIGNNQVCIHIDNSIYFYTVVNDAVGQLLDIFTLPFNFKLFPTNYPKVYICVDITNNINYKLTFNERIMLVNDIPTDINQSTELLLNEFEPATMDYTWGAMAKHVDFNSNTPVAGLGSISVSSNTVKFSGGTGAAVLGLAYPTKALSPGYNLIDSGSHIATILSIDNPTFIVGTGTISGVTGTAVTFGTSQAGTLFIGYVLKDGAGNTATIVSGSASNWVVDKANLIATGSGLWSYQVPQVTILNVSGTLATGTGAYTYAPSLSGQTYENGLNKYCIRYDSHNVGMTTEWHEIAVLSQIDPVSKQQRYVIVTGFQADTYIYIYDWGLTYPGKWTTRIKANPSKNIFLTDGTGTPNSNARFMDLLNNQTSVLSSSITWNQLGTALGNINTTNITTIGNDLYALTLKGVYKLTNKTGDWVLFGNALNMISIRNIYKINNDFYVVGMNIGVHESIYKLTNGIGSWVSISNGISINCPCYCLLSLSGNIYAGVAPAFGANGGVKVYNTTTNHWDSYGAGLDSKYAISLIYDGSKLIAGTDTAVYYYNAGTWTIYGSSFPSDFAGPLINIGTDIYACTTTHGIYYLTGGTGGTWIQYGTGITSTTTLSIVNVGNDLYTISNNVLYKMTNKTSGSAWSTFGTNTPTGETGLLILNTSIYLATTTGVYLTNYQSIDYDFTLYIPNSSNIATLVRSTTTYTNNAIASGATTVNSIKSIDSVFNIGNELRYLVISQDTNIKLYLVYKLGTMESGSIGYLLTLSSTYTNMNGMALIRNRYYDSDVNPLLPYSIGYTLFLAYSITTNTAFDVIDITTGNTTATMALMSAGSAIPSTSSYYLGTSLIYPIMILPIANISANTNIHFIYVAINKQIIKYQITGNQMTALDVGAAVSIYNYEISEYANIDGNIATGICTTSTGYVLEEINVSKPLPFRPYFTPDINTSTAGVGTPQALYASLDGLPITSELFNIYNFLNPQNQSYRSYISPGKGNTFINTQDNYVSGTSNNNYFPYWILYLLDSGIYDGHVQFINIAKGVSINNNYRLIYWQQDPNYANSTIYPDINDPTALQNLPNRFSNLSTNNNCNTVSLLGGNYTTGTGYFTITGGTTINVSDTSALAIGYKFKDSTGVTATIQTIPTSGTFTVSLDGAALTAGTWTYSNPGILPYVINNEIYYKQIMPDYGITSTQQVTKQANPRDGFRCVYFYQTNVSDKFVIQDATVFNSDMVVVCDYLNKAVYYTQGLKFINRLSKIGLLYSPTAIQSVSDSQAIIATEDTIFMLSGSTEANVSVTQVAQNIGLEIGNYASLVSNGKDCFFANRKSIFMIRNGVLIDIGEPMKDYLYRQISGNAIGIDTNKTRIYIPINSAELVSLTNILLPNDYGNVPGATITYNKMYGVFKWDDLTWKIYAYQDTTGSIYPDTFGNIGDQIVCRKDTSIIIPEYFEADPSPAENPLCRFVTKMTTMGNRGDLKKLASVVINFINTNNISNTKYGVDYIKLYIVFDNRNIFQVKYGDFINAIANYTDCPPDANAPQIPPNTQYGFENFIDIPLDIDFHDIQIYVEFARILDTNKSTTSLAMMGMDVINKGSEIKGIY